MRFDMKERKGSKEDRGIEILVYLDSLSEEYAMQGKRVFQS